MASKVSFGKSPASYLDSRDDLGYGRISTKYHVPKSRGSIFPYSEEAKEFEYDEIEDANAVMISDKMRPPRMYDSIPQRDPGYYASSGNLKLKEAGISPIPDLYKNRDGVVGGTSTPMLPGPTIGFRSKIRPTGKNWHKVDFIDDSEENAETFSLSDIADELLREYIRTTLMEIK